MSLLKVTKNFTANRFEDGRESCQEQVQRGFGIDTEEFVLNQLPLDDYGRQRIETFNGETFIRFKYQQASYWVRLATFDGSTEALPQTSPCLTHP